jgi:cytochrome c
MSSFEINKIVGAILLAGIIAMVTGFIADLLVRPTAVEHAAVSVPAQQAAAVEALAPAEEAPPIATLLAGADPAAGEALAKRCATCHTFVKGGAKKVGPNLWDIVGAKPAHMAEFAYSPAITGLTEPWDYEQLDKFLASPKAYAPGTKMSFAGMKKIEERAAVIAYLRTLSDSPRPLP